jgi:hypothetical protein
MGFLRRLFGGGEAEPTGETEPAGEAHRDEAPPRTTTSAVDEEQARDRELLREEARRLDDDLIQRQLRYADRSWTPPAQGGTRRSDDEDATRESAR